MRFECHLRSYFHIHHPPPPTNPLFSTQRRDTLEFTIHPFSSPPPQPPTCLHLDHLSPSILQRRGLTLPQHESRQGSQCNAKPSPQKSVLRAVTSEQFFQSFVAVLSETIHKLFLNVDLPLWWTWTVNMDVTIEILPVLLGSSCIPLLYSSQLRITMICEWAKVTLLILLKPSGSNHHMYRLWLTL